MVDLFVVDTIVETAVEHLEEGGRQNGSEVV